MLFVTKNLCKSFGGLRAVDAVSLEMDQGEIVGVIGPNGAGKTTFIDVVSGFYRPDSGEVWFNNKRIDGMKPHQIWRLRLSRSFQLTEMLLSFTVLEFVMLPALQRMTFTESHRRAKEVVGRIGLEPKAEQLVSRLTPAEQKLAELGKALSCEPEMVLLDEPVAGMSEVEAVPVISAIAKSAKEGVSFLLVEHRLEVLWELCSRVAVINFGKKIAEGIPEEIKANRQVVEAYLGDEHC